MQLDLDVYCLFVNLESGDVRSSGGQGQLGGGKVY